MLSMCVMDIMNVLRTGMNMSISHIHVWLCNNTTFSVQSGPGSNGKKMVLYTPQIFIQMKFRGIPRTFPFDGFDPNHRQEIQSADS